MTWFNKISLIHWIAIECLLLLGCVESVPASPNMVTAPAITGKQVVIETQIKRQKTTISSDALYTTDSFDTLLLQGHVHIKTNPMGTIRCDKVTTNLQNHSITCIGNVFASISIPKETR